MPTTMPAADKTTMEYPITIDGRRLAVWNGDVSQLREWAPQAIAELEPNHDYSKDFLVRSNGQTYCLPPIALSVDKIDGQVAEVYHEARGRLALFTCGMKVVQFTAFIPEYCIDFNDVDETEITIQPLEIIKFEM